MEIQDKVIWFGESLILFFKKKVEPESLVQRALKAVEEVLEEANYEIDLGVARDYEKISEFRECTSLTVTEITGSAKIKLNSIGQPEHDLTKIQAFGGRISRIFIYNTAQSGKKLVLTAGGMQFVKSIEDMESDIEQVQSDISTLKGEIQNLRTEVAKESTLGTLAKEATVAKESTLGTLAKEATSAKESTLATLAKEATVAKESTLGTLAKESTLGTLAKETSLGEVKDRQGKTYVLVASDTTQLSDDEQKSVWGTTYEKVKQFTILCSGVVRMYCELKAISPYSTWCEVRINGTKVDGFSETETEYQPHYADVGIGVGDLLQLWIRCSGDNASWLQNARVKCDQILGVPNIGLVK